MSSAFSRRVTKAHSVKPFQIFKMETKCVSCKVGTEPINRTQINIWLQSVNTRTVRCLILLRPHVNSIWFLDKQPALWKHFLLLKNRRHVNVHARSTQGKPLRRRMLHAHPHMHTCTSYLLLSRSTAAFHLRHDLTSAETYFCGRCMCRLIMGYSVWSCHTYSLQ